MLGSDCICHYLVSGTQSPKSEYQHVHSDIYRLFSNGETTPLYSISTNIPLVVDFIHSGFHSGKWCHGNLVKREIPDAKRH